MVNSLNEGFTNKDCLKYLLILFLEYGLSVFEAILSPLCREGYLRCVFHDPRMKHILNSNTYRIENSYFLWSSIHYKQLGKSSGQSSHKKPLKILCRTNSSHKNLSWVCVLCACMWLHAWFISHITVPPPLFTLQTYWFTVYYHIAYFYYSNENNFGRPKENNMDVKNPTLKVSVVFAWQVMRQFGRTSETNWAQLTSMRLAQLRLCLLKRTEEGNETMWHVQF